ncbi:AAA family ATPase [Bifidobacterium callitrichos]|uniref:AAA family ATPase n=1 Tax=Bifidobacterium callitrichos TaxID=762209 RepID=UPI001CC30C33|nr:AAA family ATPase [Bifidobacterium callitrichos]
MPTGYRSRIVDAQIERYMRIFGAVEIAGTKWCGKTWSARAHASSITYVDRGSNLDVARADPSLMLIGERPHVIDEWQLVPDIWDEVRHGVDDEPGEKGRWLLTGSSTPLGRQAPHHSGAGRIRMNPMTLTESGVSSGEVSLAGLFGHRFAAARSPVDTRSLLDAVCRGGWPEAVGRDRDQVQ